ncbi:MAG: M14 family metallopeptidase [Rudaea sp.]|nr:M14 family metallopeptidase [Rudaea sp.]
MSHAADWTTPAEAAQFKTTPDYAQTHAWLERLAAAAPKTIRLTRFGVSPEGRDLMLVVAASGGDFTPEAAHKSGKQILLVQAGIHAGEIEGKDAGLMLLRDLALDDANPGGRSSRLGGKFPHLLEHTILLYLPIFNVDGHENSSPWNRINQVGPEEMGFRATAQNLNLNRDYMKADAPEMHDWLKLFNAWLPDLFVDVHTTDGADYQYDLTWYTEDWGSLDPAVKSWQDTALKNSVFPQMESHDHHLSPYLDLKDHRDITKGIGNFGSGPRFSTGYVALQNRAALLVETHMLKPYAARVHATYDLIALILAYLDAHPAELRQAVTSADRNTVARAAQAGVTLPIAFKTSEAAASFTLKGVQFTQTHSDISGDVWTQYDPSKPKTFQIPFWRDLVAGETVHLPAAYVIPAGWPQLVEKLRQHGVHLEPLARAVALDAERYRLSDPKWADAPFEGRLMLREFDAKVENVANLKLAPGAVLVPMDQRAANVAVNLLEPDAPDSLVRWGFVNAIFEQKESGDARVLEKLARDMLAADPALKARFEARLKNDPAFARNPEARLEFFYRLSPWYTQQNVGVYPVLKLDAAALAAARAQ